MLISVKSFVVIMVLFTNGQTGIGRFEFDPPATCKKAWHYIMAQNHVAHAEIMECHEMTPPAVVPTPRRKPPKEREAERTENRITLAPLTNG